MTRLNPQTRRFLELFVSKGLTISLLLLINILVGRGAGPEGYATWLMLTAAATLVHSAFVNWTHAGTVRFGAAEWAAHGSLKSVMAARFPLLALTLVFAFAVVLFQPGDWLVSIYGVPRNLRWLTLLCFIAIWLTAESQATLQAVGRISTQAWIAPFVAGVTAATAAILLVVPDRALRVEIVILVVSSSVAIALWGGAWGLTLIGNFKSPRQSAIDMRTIVVFGWPLIPTFLVGYLTIWSDHVILRFFRTQAEVGLFGSAYQIVLGVISANGVMTTLLVPWLSARSVRDPSIALNFVSRVAPTLYSLWLLFAIPVVAVLLPLYAEYMGTAFVEALPMLAILAIVIPSSAITFLYTGLFTLQSRLHVSLRYAVLMLAINVAISLALTPGLGGIGASIATTTALIAGQALGIVDQHKLVGANATRTWVLWGVALVLSAFQLLNFTSWPLRLIWGVISMAAIVATVRMTGAADPEVLRSIFSGRLSGVGALLEGLLAIRRRKAVS